MSGGACGRELEFLTFPLVPSNFGTFFVPKRHDVPFAPVIESSCRECPETLIPEQRPPPDLLSSPSVLIHIPNSGSYFIREKSQKILREKFLNLTK